MQILCCQLQEEPLRFLRSNPMHGGVGNEIEQEIERFATRAGRTPAALRAQFEKEGGIGRLVAGLRREKAVDLALSRARIS